MKQFRQLLDPKKYQVFLFTCPATLPFSFATHPWFVVNKKGVISRWEVVRTPEGPEGKRWGHIHKDFFPPAQGIPIFPFSAKPLRKRVTLRGYVEGEEGSLAQQMLEYIGSSPESYPYRDRYALPGPNSNTYIQWVLDRFPSSGLRLPTNAFGKAGCALRYNYEQ